MQNNREPLLRRSNDNIDEQQQQYEQDSEDQRIKQQQRIRLQSNYSNKKKQVKSMVVGTGFSFDITQFFKFQKAKDVQAGELVNMMTSQQATFKKLSGGHLAWFILLYSVCNAAMIPPWIMSIKATKFLRISWRFLLQTFMIIPFVLYERRTGDENLKKKYSFQHILKQQNIKKIYISSFATSFWFMCILTCFQWTYISHAMILGSLSNFFLSITRAFKLQSNHELQKGGQVLVLIGVFMVMQDSYYLDPSQVPKSAYQVINPFYLQRTFYQRVLSDLIAFGVSFCMSNFSRYTSDLKQYYPPYLSMLIINIFICINMCLGAYFFNGATFDMHSFFGVFAIFTQKHFAGFLYMSIILGLGLFMSFVMITKLFSQPIAPALAMLFDPIFSTLMLSWATVQTIPGSLACIGYVFIMPGLFLILMGQHLIRKSTQETQRILVQVQKNEKQRQQLQIKIGELQKIVEEKNKN